MLTNLGCIWTDRHCWCKPRYMRVHLSIAVCVSRVLMCLCVSLYVCVYVYATCSHTWIVMAAFICPNTPMKRLPGCFNRDATSWMFCIHTYTCTHTRTHTRRCHACLCVHARVDVLVYAQELTHASARARVCVCVCFCVLTFTCTQMSRSCICGTCPLSRIACARSARERPSITIRGRAYCSVIV